MERKGGGGKGGGKRRRGVSGCLLLPPLGGEASLAPPPNSGPGDTRTNVRGSSSIQNTSVAVHKSHEVALSLSNDKIKSLFGPKSYLTPNPTGRAGFLIGFCYPNSWTTRSDFDVFPSHHD